MDILDKIRTADPRTRVSFLHPDRAAESICDIQALRKVAVTQEVLERLAYRAKVLTDGIDTRERRCADKADFLAAFEHELFGKDEKLGRRSELRKTVTDGSVTARNY